jgi:hypothetical protein
VVMRVTSANKLKRSLLSCNILMCHVPSRHLSCVITGISKSSAPVLPAAYSQDIFSEHLPVVSCKTHLNYSVSNRLGLSRTSLKGYVRYLPWEIHLKIEGCSRYHGVDRILNKGPSQTISMQGVPNMCGSGYVFMQAVSNSGCT